MHTLHITPAPASQTSPSHSELALMLLGPSAAMAQLWSQLRRLATHVRTVLLAGPPDVGHEAAARLLRDLSPHPERPFLTLNSAKAEEYLSRVNNLHSLPPEIVLFFPDIECLSATAQHCLLTLLRTRRNRGFAVAASSSEDLRSLATLGRFSAPLAEILGAVRVPVPALHERLEDVPMLLGHMLARHAERRQRRVPQLADELLRAAMRQPWTGNLRDLARVAEALSDAGADGRELGTPDLVRALECLRPAQPSSPIAARMVKLDTVVQEHISAVLRGCHGNKLRAAEVLGISRSTLYRMLDNTAGGTSMPLAS